MALPRLTLLVGGLNVGDKVVHKHLYRVVDDEVLVELIEGFAIDVRVSPRPVLGGSLRFLLRVRAIKQVDLLAFYLAVVGLLMRHWLLDLPLRRRLPLAYRLLAAL